MANTDSCLNAGLYNRAAITSADQLDTGVPNDNVRFHGNVKVHHGTCSGRKCRNLVELRTVDPSSKTWTVPFQSPFFRILFKALRFLTSIDWGFPRFSISSAAASRIGRLMGMKSRGAGGTGKASSSILKTSGSLITFKWRQNGCFCMSGSTLACYVKYGSPPVAWCNVMFKTCDTSGLGFNAPCKIATSIVFRNPAFGNFPFFFK